MGQERYREAWRGWLSLIFCPLIAVAAVWESVHLILGTEPLVSRYGLVSPLLLVAIAAGFTFVAVRIVTVERRRWPVGLSPGLRGRLGKVLLAASASVTAIALVFAAVAQARFVSWL